jgi:tripartite-type tricarboxylate transporter receptor subunit TctC
VIRTVAFVLSTFSVAPSFAQVSDYPAKPVRVIVASPGSPQDVVARIVGNRLGELWKQSVVIENRAGAGSLLSMQTTAKSAADGYSILVSSSAFAVTPALYPDSGLDLERDFIPVAMLAVSPNVIVAAPSLGVTSLQEAIAKSRSGAKLQFGSPGHGTAPALVLDYVAKVLAKVDMTHVPYKGAIAPMAAASTGEVALAATGLAPALSFIRSGKVKAIAVTSAKRSAALPDVPTLAEAGFSSVDDEQWIGAWVPAKTPGAVIDRIADGLAQSIRTPDVTQRLGAVGYEISGMSRDDMVKYVRAEVEKWARIAKATGAKAE